MIIQGTFGVIQGTFSVFQKMMMMITSPFGQLGLLASSQTHKTSKYTTADARLRCSLRRCHNSSSLISCETKFLETTVWLQVLLKATPSAHYTSMDSSNGDGVAAAGRPTLLLLTDFLAHATLSLRQAFTARHSLLKLLRNPSAELPPASLDALLYRISPAGTGASASEATSISKSGGVGPSEVGLTSLDRYKRPLLRHQACCW
jgi:hypothetical protein